MNNIKKSIVIVGGGAAGIFASIAAKASGADVVILEKMNQIGVKLSITGGGRCNITHKVDDFKELIDYYPSGGRFLYSALSRFGPRETLDLFHDIGIKTKTDRGGRIFPEFESAPELVRILTEYLQKLGVKIVLSRKVEDVVKDEDFFTVKTDKGEYKADKVILTTGALSYPRTGSTGDGFKIAEKLGHPVTTLLPSLVPLEVKESWVKDLQGLTLKNVEAYIFADDKKVSEKFGDLIFTHFGISGPIILYLSRQIVKLMHGGKKIKIVINLKPALSYDKLDARLQRDFVKSSKKQFKNMLAGLLPGKMIALFTRLLDVNPDLICSQITAEQRKKLMELLTGLEFNIEKDMGFYYAEVTQGGVDLSGVNPKTMESRIISGLYFAGEILDIDGYIGGYNLQAAFSTGFIAGENAASFS
ncbi:MAG: NAD(P)/FAD-dependent oxidoreductase [Armatimonadota bacterium]